MTHHPPIMHVISLGAGVQSTTMALMAAHGEIEPMPDAAIFADTGAEPTAVYEHLDCLALFGFAVASRVSAVGEPGQGSRSFLVVEDARPAAARGP